jgi:hypothetical protein
LERTTGVVRHGPDPKRQVEGTATCPGRSGPRPHCLMSEGSCPCGLTGRVMPGPWNLLGFLLYESGPSGAPGLHPCQRPPSGSAIFVIVEPLHSVLMTPGRGVLSTYLRSLLSACASAGVTEPRRS